MKKIYLNIFLSFLAFLFFQTVHSQIQVTANPTITQIVNNLAGTGAIISNATIVCPNGAYGTFANGNTTNLGITSGVLLTTGSATAVNGTAGSFASVDNAGGGNTLLGGMAGATTYEECRLEFDIMPTCSSLQMSYVFGSEEYPEFVNSGYNDAFGFFVSGPNPSGGTYNNVNIANVPGTGTFVGIDNVNSSTNSAYYVNNSASTTIAYDGLTTVLTASVNVTPCQTYHMILVIADGGDGVYDSGVFLTYQGLTCPSPTVAVAGTATVCPGQSTTLTASGMTSYTWTPGGQTGASITVTPTVTTTYTVNATQGLCNTDSGTVTVTVAAPASSAGNTGPYCVGSTISLSATGGGTYSWSGPNSFTSTAQNPTIPSATTAMSGVYTVTVTSGSCTSVATTTVTVNAAGSGTASNTGPYCPGQTISLSATGGATYSWSGPNTFTSTAQNPTIAGATTAMDGVYTVTVTTGSCTSIATTSVSVSAGLTPTASNTGPYCVNGTIQLNATGGGTYSWSGPNTFTSTAQSPSITSATTAMAGVYTVTVTAGTCTGTATTTVVVNSTLTPSLSSNSPICEGQNLDLSCTNGSTWAWTGPNSFSSSLQNPTVTGATTLASGTYNITVTDANGCTGTGNISVVVSPSVTLSTSSVDANCNGTCDGQVSVTVSGGTAGFTYAWSSGCTTASCTNLCGGTYNVTVTDAAGCSASSSAVVNQSSALGAVIQSATNVSCNGACDGTATANVPAGTGTYTYSWNTNPAQTTATATGLCAGTYVCTVAAASCTPSGIEMVSNGDFSAGNTGFSSSYNYVTPPNIGESEYFIGTGPQVSTWNGGMFSNGDHTTGTGNLLMVNGSSTPNSSVWCQTINVSPNTTYEFSTWVSSLNNSSPAQLQFSINGITIGSIFSAPATANIWSQFFNTWNSGANTTANICIINQNTSLGGNDFALDDISFQPCIMPCPDTVMVTITEPAPMAVNAGVDDTICNGNTFTLTASGGPAGTTYTWNPGGLTGASQTFTATATTTFIVTGADANNCTASDTVVITVPPVFTLATGGFPATCSGVCNGQVVVLPNPTTGPFATYTYLWSNGATTASVNNLCAGTYSLAVTDAAGCIDTASAVVTEPASVAATVVSTTPATCNSACNGTASISASGGTIPYNYSWSSLGTGNNPVNLCAGSYTCTVTDNNGCQDTVQLTITEPAAITASITPVSTICIGQTATLTANANGGNSGYVYTWTGGTIPTTGQTVSASPTVTSTYNVSITDANGCPPGTASITVTVAPPLSVVAASNQTICNGESANLNALGNGGNGSYNYSWTPSSAPLNGTPVTVSPVTTTVYTVTVTDGCGTPASTSTVTITVNPLPVLGITALNNVGCEPVCADFVLTSVPSMSVSSWTFTDGQTASNDSTPQICFDNAGTYGASVTVTDVNGCTNSTSGNNLVTVYPMPTAEFSSAPQPTTELDPVIYFTDSSYGGNIVSWQWNFGDPNDSISFFQHPFNVYDVPGTYDVELVVTTDNGCSDTIVHPVVIDPDFVIYIPNAFSPNGECCNETFYPVGIGVSEDNFQMWIYDRWGNMIWSTTEWGKGWDGKVMGHDDVVQQDVYVWKIKLETWNGQKKSYVGHVTVVK